MLDQLIIWGIGQLVVAAAIWGTIKAELRHLHASLSLERMEREKQDDILRAGLDAVHRRLDAPRTARALERT